MSAFCPLRAAIHRRRLEARDLRETIRESDSTDEIMTLRAELAQAELDIERLGDMLRTAGPSIEDVTDGAETFGHHLRAA